MLATVRRALGQTSHTAPRRLYAALSVAPVLEHAQDANSSPSQTLGIGSSSVSSVAGKRPLYLQMSSLITSERDVHPSDELVELDPDVFAHPIRRDILHLCAVHYLDGQRQGSASTKTRGEVRGSGRKMRPQKGSGRARLGDGQSPMLRGGGVVFGPKPRDFATKLNRKVLEMGMRSALSARVKEHSLGVVRTLDWQGHKTKEFQRRIEQLGWTRTLFITGEGIPDGLDRASRNLQGVDTVVAEDLEVYHALKWPRLILDVAAVEWFERRLGRQPVLPRSYDV